MKRIKAASLEVFLTDLLKAGGFTAEESQSTARSLIISSLYGHDSHGILRVRQYIAELSKDTLRSGVELEILSETPSSVHADAQCGLGQVQMPRLLERLYAKTVSSAVVTASLRNSGHVGRLGEWVEHIAERGLAGFVAVNDNGTYLLVSPDGGCEGRTSTNPIAFGIPLNDGKTFCIDLSTSATAMGKIRLAYLAGERLPEGLIQDYDGNPSTDPSVMIEEPRGSILPAGGYKGFALSMMVDCLVSGLSGGFTPPAPTTASITNNVLICIWNPALFAGIQHMRKEAEKYLEFIRATKPADPAKPVRVPGDRAKAERQAREKLGIPISDALRESLVKDARTYGIDIPAYLI